MNDTEIILVSGLAIHLHRRANARNYSLRINPRSRQIRLTMPIRGSKARALKFAEEYQDWIKRKWNAIEQPCLQPKDCVPLRGAMLKIHHIDQLRIIEHKEENLFIGGKIEHLPRRLKDFLKSEARKDIVPLCIEKSMKIGAKLPAIRIKEMHSRWGSCGKSLNFNWRLIMAPSFVLDYVVAHEVAHLKHRHHQQSFWDLCHSLCPDMKTAREWLIQSGGELYKFGG